MTKPPPDASNTAWLDRFLAGTGPVKAATPAFRPQSSPSERKADDLTRAVREITAAATKKRVTTTARLKAARLGKEADDRAQAALEPPTTQGKPKAKAKD
jgi:hypothetical protein